METRNSLEYKLCFIGLTAGRAMTRNGKKIEMIFC